MMMMMMTSVRTKYKTSTFQITCEKLIFNLVDMNVPIYLHLNCNQPVFFLKKSSLSENKHVQHSQ